MITYNDYLNEVGIIPEEQFNELIDSLPDFDEFNWGGISPDDDIDYLATEFIDTIINDYDYVYVESANFGEKTIELNDVSSIKDLEEIKEKLSNWIISNYDKIKEDLLIEEKEEEENKIHREKMLLFSSIVDDLSIDDIKEFVNAHKN